MQPRGSSIGSWLATIDQFLLIAILITIVISAIMVTTASPAVAERIGLTSYYFIKRQIIFLILGFILMLCISFMPYNAIRKFCFLGFVLFFLLLIMVLFVGEEIKGARRWISLGFIAIQPSEFIKPFFAVVTSIILSKHFSKKTFPAYSLSLCVYSLVVGLLILQPDFGMAITISVVWAGQMFLAGISMIWVIVLTIGGLIGVVAAYNFLPHVAHRINSFLDPQSVENYQVKKSLEAYSNGGLLGRGPGEGTVKQSLPDSHTDFIFAVVGEEFGIIACFFIIILFAFIVLRGIYRVSTVGDIFAKISVIGILMQIGFQSVINIGVTLHLLPTKGITLPFISYGGSSILSVSIAMGIVLVLTRKRYGIRKKQRFLELNGEYGK